MAYYIIFGLNDPHFKDFIDSTLEDVLLDEAFVQSSNGELLNKHLQHVRGDCVAKRISINEIKMNVLSVFRIGDPLEFKGRAIGEVVFAGYKDSRFLVIEVDSLSDTLVYVRINHEGKIKLKQKVL